MAYAVRCDQANGRWDLHYDRREPHARNRSVGSGTWTRVAGSLYYNGRGVSKNDATAVSWFRKGAGKGSYYAMGDLAACYWTGTGVEKSAREAIKWWKLAADKGNEEAKANLKTALEQFDESGQPRTRK